MTIKERQKYILDQEGPANILNQAVEEAVEVAHALNKLYRAEGYGTCTPVSREEAMDALCEELADLELCLCILGLDMDGAFQVRKARYMGEKETRWLQRLEEMA